MLSTKDLDCYEPNANEHEISLYQDVIGPNYKLESFVGGGTFGAVYFGRNLQTKADIAVKVILRKFWRSI